jgi:CDP-glucose 4,6-dehydratase|tara:strand:- start:649 stop:1704 length:1056 start_codon:yes stop_codon:yes gene_type:complete
MLNLKFFKGKKIFITGHTGFKGSWLSYILYLSGAKLAGYSLKPKNKFDNFYLLKLDKKIINCYGDVRNKKKLSYEIKKFKPDIIFHLAAQPLVKESYKNPIYTFSTNILGTLNILETLRELKSVKSAVIITSDKCYKNYEKKSGYSEDDELGGEDPYSASKASAENVFFSYYKSFFKNRSKLGLASVRAGNVIGGGDWSQDRIIPDLIKSIIVKKKFTIRSPKSTRPWQHIFDLLNGYLILARKIYKNNKFNGSWNFGPNKSHVTVIEVISKLIKILRVNKEVFIKSDKKIKETGLLSLKTNKSKKNLKWKTKLSLNQSLKIIADWYLCYINDKKSIEKFSKQQIESFFYD